MSEKKRKTTSEEIIASYRPRMEEWLKYAYNEGYGAGKTEGTAEVERLRSLCHREAGEHDDKYAEGWRDHTPFYGWCSECKRPHSGRWAHVWEYCPWCGARIDRTAPEPYPLGKKEQEAATR